MSERSLLLLGGHDSSGRAGVDADREVAVELGWAPRCVVTVWTEQDDGGVHALRPRASEDWAREAREALEAGAAALKVGLVGDARALAALGALVDAFAQAGRPVVVDPVLGASTGHVFVADEDLDRWRAEVLARGVVVTPNLPEAARLAGRALDPAARADLAVREELAERLLEAGAGAVVLKGGHGAEDPVRDLVRARDEEPVWLAHPRLVGASIRGSGCRHATAVACGLAEGRPLAEAAAAAARIVVARLR